MVKQFPEGCNLQRKRAFCRALVPKQKSQKCPNKNKAELKRRNEWRQQVKEELGVTLQEKQRQIAQGDGIAGIGHATQDKL